MIYEHFWICTVYRSSSFALKNLEIKTNFFHRILYMKNGELAKVRYPLYWHLLETYQFVQTKVWSFDAEANISRKIQSGIRLLLIPDGVGYWSMWKCPGKSPRCLVAVLAFSPVGTSNRAIWSSQVFWRSTKDSEFGELEMILKDFCNQNETPSLKDVSPVKWTWR